MVDLNCDLGESFGAYRIGNDEALLDVVSSANIACGFHAGDPRVLERAVSAAAARGVGIGAHPGFPDLVGFGRRAIDADPVEVRTDVLYQLGAISAFCRAAGVALEHVKPHGALYNQALVDPRLAEAIASAVAAFDPRLILVAIPGSQLARAGERAGLTVAYEAFADRHYQPDGTLVPRRQTGATIHDPDEAARRVVRLVREGKLTAVDGSELTLRVHTVCLHGDHPEAVHVARAVRRELERQGIAVEPLAVVLGRRSKR
ncbi:MAG TPA: 5-oxoprolinase subunit PxpA [Bacillota bacterium]